MKRLISMFLAVCLSFATVPAVFAAEFPISVPGLAVSDSAAITTTMDEQYEYFSIVDSENGTAQAVLKDRQTQEYIYGPVIEIDSIGEGIDDTTIVPSRASNPTYHQDTFSNYEYDIWEYVADSDWLLQRPKDEFRQYSFMTLEDGNNWRELVHFRQCVDDLNDQEFVVIGYVGDAALKVAVALATSYAAASSYGALTPAAWSAVWDAIDASSTAINALETFGAMYNDCAYAYFDALDVSSPYEVNDPNYP